MAIRMYSFWPVAVVLALLSGVMAETVLFRPRPKDAEPFHQRIRDAAKAAPMVIGDWTGEDIQVPQAAVTLLKPNVMISRRYRNEKSMRVIEFLLVQCRDARDMQGHYPPVCYPAHGYEQHAAKAMEWNVGEQVLPGMEYEYARTVEGQGISRTVCNLMILPDGRLIRQMDDMYKVAANYLRQFYGAAQVQVVTDSAVPAEERAEIVQTFLGAYLPILETLRSGGTR